MSERTTDHAQRAAMIERHLAGESLQHIADDLRVNRFTVRKWWRRYRAQGWSGIVMKASGPPPRGALSDFDPRVKYVALRLKRENPGWGLDLLLLYLQRRPSLQGLTLPKRTALWNYLHSFYPRLMEHRRLPTQRPRAAPNPLTAVHQRWQMDFKGEVSVPGLGLLLPWNVCDEFTSAPLACHLYALPRSNDGRHVTMRDTQHCLRQVFTQFGLPDALRMDRDPRWIGSTRLEWPGALLLWLVGLGVTPVINRPHRPTDNAQIERHNRTWHEHVGLSARGHSLQELQELSNRDLADRRQSLPSHNPHCQGLPPLLAHPELAQPRRPYAPGQEAALFQLQRVYDYLAQWEWRRKVDSTGSISLADLNRCVSRAHVGQVVRVRFDPQTAEFVACTLAEEELRRFTLPVISIPYILGDDPGGTELANIQGGRPK